MEPESSTLHYSKLDATDDVELASFTSMDDEITSTLRGRKKSTLRQTISEGGSTLTEVLFNMLNAIVGAGIVGIPFIYTQCGLIGGIVLICVFAVVTVYSLRLLIKTAKQVSCRTYEELCQLCFGRTGYISVLLALFIFDFGALLTYLIILGDAASNVLCEFAHACSTVGRQLSILVLSLGLILPWCLFRDISKIERVSLVSILTVLLIIGVVFAEFIMYSTDSGQSDQSAGIENVDTVYFRPQGFVSSIGTVAFAFVCHDSSFLLYNTLANPTIPRWNRLTRRSILAAVVITLLFSMFGYLTFGQGTKDNILNNYDADDVLVIVTRLIYVATMALTYPTAFYVVRHVLYAMYVALKYGLDAQQQDAGAVAVGVGVGVGVTDVAGNDVVLVPSLQDVTTRTHLLVTVPPFLISVGLAMILNDLGFVMNVTGSLAAVYIAFIMPSFCCIKVWIMDGKYNLKKKSVFWSLRRMDKQNLKEIGLPLLLGVLGSIIAIVSTSYTIYVKFQ